MISGSEEPASPSLELEEFGSGSTSGDTVGGCLSRNSDARGMSRSFVPLICLVLPFPFLPPFFGAVFFFMGGVVASIIVWRAAGAGGAGGLLEEGPASGVTVLVQLPRRLVGAFVVCSTTCVTALVEDQPEQRGWVDAGADSSGP